MFQQHQKSSFPQAQWRSKVYFRRFLEQIVAIDWCIIDSIITIFFLKMEHQKRCFHKPSDTRKLLKRCFDNKLLNALKLEKLEMANFAHFVSFPLGENLLKHLFWQKLEILNALKLQQLENANFTHFSYARLVKTIQIPILTKVRDFQSCGASRAWKGKLFSFCKQPTSWKIPKDFFCQK